MLTIGRHHLKFCGGITADSLQDLENKYNGNKSAVIEFELIEKKETSTVSKSVAI